jgi:DNA-binding PadR family transcriptional regulator
MAQPISRKKQIGTINSSEFHILLALADRQRHGYGIMQEVEERSAGTVRLGPGTLYTAIKRMLAAGLIEESAERPVEKDDDSRRRCYYRLTRLGRQTAVEESERLAALVRVAEMKRLLGRKTPAAAGGAG